MSKISYCSLEEAWGDSFNRKDITTNDQKKKNEINKYDKLVDDSDTERKNVIKNMNTIERNKVEEKSNDSIVEYNKYRFNQENKVNSTNYDKNYSPFNDSIEKKYLQDKINYLESEFRKYKYFLEKPVFESNNKNEPTIEHFENDNNNNIKESKDTDIIDLIVLIIIGILIIFVLNSIFNIGKAIGMRNKSL
jgi:hypothetical protein